MIKQFFYLMAIIALTFTLFSFQPRSSQEQTNLNEHNNNLKIALILPTTTQDYSLGQSIYESLIKIKQKGGLSNSFDITIESNITSIERTEEKLTLYAEKKYDIIIAHGFLYRDAVANIAPKFPSVSFVTFLKTEEKEPHIISNVFTYDVASEEAGYVNGVAAALVANLSNIGMICPEYDLHEDIKAYIVGFQNGVKSTAPLTHIKMGYTKSPWHPQYSNEPAGLMILDKTRILTGIYPQAIGAIGVAEQNNMYWFGAEYNQSSLAPNNVLLSMAYKWDDTLQSIITKRKNGVLGGENYFLNIANGGIQETYNQGAPLDSRIKVAIEKVILGIKNGYVHPLENKFGF